MIIKNMRTGTTLRHPTGYVNFLVPAKRLKQADSYQFHDAKIVISVSIVDALKFPAGSVLYVKNMAYDYMETANVLLWVVKIEMTKDDQYNRDLICKPITNLEAIEKMAKGEKNRDHKN